MVNGKASKYFKGDADFLMGLGSLYLAHNLLDSAEELLAQIPPEGALYFDAVVLQIEIQSRKQNYQEIVRLAETLGHSSNCPAWLLEKIGVAYYFQGQASNAKSYFLKGMAGVPENSHVRDILMSLRPSNQRPKIEELIMGGFEIGNTPHVALDCIAPILWGGRPASCCFWDQLLAGDQPSNSEPNQQNFYVKFAANLYQRFGIFTAFLPYVDLSLGQCVPLLKLLFSLDPSVFDRVEDIKQLAWSEFDKQEQGSNHRFEYLEKEGALLGYPKCCVERALKNRRSNKSIEALALKALIEEEYVCSLETGKPSPPGWAYFAHEFYPCDPRCAAAEGMGIDIFERYREKEPFLADLYCQHVLSVNKAKMYYPRTPYTEFIDNFNKTIIQILKIEAFKKAHEDFDLYHEEMLVILKEYPYFENPEGLPLVYAMAKERASQKLATNVSQAVN